MSSEATLASRTDPQLVTVVIPVHNGEEYVADAIESVLGQTHRSFECIVVDDGSTDGTADVVRSFGSAVQLLQQPKSGVAAARNHGSSVGRGAYLAFLDADDVWLPTKLVKQVAALACSRDAGLVLCGMQITDFDLQPTGLLKLDPLIDLLKNLVLLEDTGMVGISQAALIRRECFTAIKGFDERLSTSADWEFLVRFLRRFGWGYVEEPLVLYRVRADSMSKNVGAMEHDLLLTFAELFGDPTLEPQLRVLRRSAYAHLHRILAGSYFVVGDYGQSIAHACASARQRPAELLYYLRWPLRRMHRVVGSG